MTRSSSSIVLSAPAAPVVTLLLGTVLLASACVVMFVVRIGHVIVTLTPDRGIHSGDLGAVPVALLGAALLVATLRPSAPSPAPTRERSAVAGGHVSRKLRALIALRRAGYAAVRPKRPKVGS